MNTLSRSYVVFLALALSCAACSPKGEYPAGRRASFAASNPEATSDVWKSETTGKRYRVRVERGHFYANWIDLPTAAAQHGAYIRTVCERSGSKWVGTSSIFLPCTDGEGKAEHIANTCHLTLKIEIDSIGKHRITGRAESLRKFDCQTCKVAETGWADFVWVPVQ